MSCREILNLSNAHLITGTRYRNPKFNLPSQYKHGGFGFQVNIVKKPRCCCPPFAISSLDLPLLPFTTNEVLVPSESKTLHLYEARYLALLEEALLRKSFVHFVLDPIMISNSGEASFAARYGCLVIVENVERLDVGALVSIRGVGRVKIMKFLQSEPYLRGKIIPMQDRGDNDYSTEMKSKIKAVKDAMHNLISLEMKLKAPREALLQTRTANSLLWAEKEPTVESDAAFIPPLAERISFSAFQPITGSTQAETFKLQKQKLRAMDVKNTIQRLDNSLELVNESISMIAAKLAIQSLEMQ